MKARNTFYTLSILVLVILMTGCAATYTEMRYGELQVENRMSSSIFLDPVSLDMRTVYVQVRNTTDKPFDLQPEVVRAVEAKGYRVVDDPARAQFLLQANVLSVGVSDEAALEKAQGVGFGGPIAGVAIGALLGGASRGVEGAVIGGLVGTAAELISGSAVKVNTYAVITDLQISQRAASRVRERFDSSIKQGSGHTYVRQDSSAPSDWKRYQTRIVSSARRTNLSFEEAYPHLREGITRSIAGVL